MKICQTGRKKERKMDKTPETTGKTKTARKLACLKWNKGIGKSRS